MHRVEFRLLGPMETLVRGDRLPLVDSREQRILAALLLDVGRVVPVPRLVDAVWESAPPHSAAKGVRNAVSNLRRRLPADVIATEPAGYLLRVGDDDYVDLQAFLGGLARARQLAAAGSVEEAVGRMRAALALWRGDALAGVAGRTIRAAAARLDEQRMSTQEECLAHELTLGCDRQLIDELTSLVAAHPLRERPRAQLMLALYRSGRRSEALESYLAAHRALVDELGIEPGRELRDLQQAMLVNDPRLGMSAPLVRVVAAVEDGSPLPAQLPADLPTFTGRGRELSILDRLLAEGGPVPPVVISAVSGTAGVGKTALAVHWAHQVRDRFPDGQLYVNLRGFDPSDAAVSPAEAVRGFLDALGVPPSRVPAGLDAMAALYRSLLAGRRVLVVLDNAREADQVRQLLPGSPGCLVVVTSRNLLTPLVATAGARPLVLDLLSTGEARELLDSRLGPDRTAAEPDAAADIVAGCVGLPLALSVVAARAATRPEQPLAVVAAELRDARLDALRGGDTATDLRAVFSWSYQALPEAAARLFRLLGVHPGPDLGLPAAASLAAVSRREAGDLLDELRRASLVAMPVPGRHTLHDLLRGYAAELADPTESAAALRRVLEHYLHTACGADRLLSPHRGDPLVLDEPDPGVTPERLGTDEAALAWFTGELDVLYAAVQRAVSAGLDAYVWRLGLTLDTFLDRQGYWAEWTTISRTALSATDRLGDPVAQAQVHRALGHAYVRQGHLEQATVHIGQARDLADTLGDHLGQAQAHHTLGFISGQQGDQAQAFDHAARALALYRAAGHEAGQAKALNAIGWFHAQQGEYAQAVEHCEQALVRLRRIDDRYGQAHTLDSIGYAQQRRGDPTGAVNCYRQALDLFRELGDRRLEAEVLTHLGEGLLSCGDTGAACVQWRRALEILDELGHTEETERVRALLASARP